MAAAAAPYIIAGLTSLAGALGNRGSTSHYGETPTYDPQQKKLRDALLSFYGGQSANVDELANMYTAAGMQDINQNYAVNQRLLENMLRARGLSRTNVAASGLGTSVAERLRQLVQMRTLGREQFRQGIMGQSANFLQSLPYGRTGYGTQPANVAGGAVGGAASSLAALYGMGAFSKPGQTPTNSFTPPPEKSSDSIFGPETSDPWTKFTPPNTWTNPNPGINGVPGVTGPVNIGDYISRIYGGKP